AGAACKRRGAPGRLLRTRSVKASVAITRIGAYPGAIAALEVAAVVVIIITATATLAFAGDGCTRAGTDDSANRSATGTADRTPDDRARGSAEDGAAKGVLRRRLMGRHRCGQSQQSRHSRLPNHFRDSPCVASGGLFALVPAEVNDPARPKRSASATKSPLAC